MKIRLPAVLSAFLLVLSLTLLPVAAEGDADPAQTPAGKDGQTVTAKATSATAGGDTAPNKLQPNGIGNESRHRRSAGLLRSLRPVRPP